MSITRLLWLAAVVYSIYWVSQPDGCGIPGSLACPDPALEEGVGVTLDAARICKSAGYLCNGRKTFQVARWALDKGNLLVRIAPPGFLEGDTAQQIHAAAIEGIMEWDGHPFPIEIDTSILPFPPTDMRVAWAKGSPTQGGHAILRGKADGKRFRFIVDALSVAVPRLKVKKHWLLCPVTVRENFSPRSRG